MKLGSQIRKHVDQFVFDNVLHVRTRDMMKYVRDNLNENLVGVEIGLNKGLNAENILSTCDIHMLYLVDPVHMDAECRIHRFNGKYEILYGKSWDVASQIPNELDFVYVDGDHSYEGAKRDIALYFPKVRRGGVFGGHDFSVHQWSVAKAVLEFIDHSGLELYYAPSRGSDWWVVKK